MINEACPWECLYQGSIAPVVIQTYCIHTCKFRDVNHCIREVMDGQKYSHT